MRREARGLRINDLTDVDRTFLTLDGPSAVGKTTVCEAFGAWLSAYGINSLLTATPSVSMIGTLARLNTHEISGHALSCLVAADRYHHYETVIEPALTTGTAVICDRYVPSALALDRIDGVSPEFIANLYANLPAPRLAFVLVAEPAVCRSRATDRAAMYSRFHSLDLLHHERERALFEEAVHILDRWTYPVRRVDIGEMAPQAIVEKIAGMAGFR